MSKCVIDPAYAANCPRIDKQMSYKKWIVRACNECRHITRTNHKKPREQRHKRTQICEIKKYWHHGRNILRLILEKIRAKQPTEKILWSESSLHIYISTNFEQLRAFPQRNAKKNANERPQIRAMYMTVCAGLLPCAGIWTTGGKPPTWFPPGGLVEQACFNKQGMIDMYEQLCDWSVIWPRIVRGLTS